MKRIHKTISAQDARVLKALCEHSDETPLTLIADALGVAWADFRASMRRLFLRVPVHNEMRLVATGVKCNGPLGPKGENREHKGGARWISYAGPGGNEAVLWVCDACLTEAGVEPIGGENEESAIRVSWPAPAWRTARAEAPPSKLLWKALTVLESDYSKYGGRVERWSDPQHSDEDCSCGCRWACWLEGSGDWLVCSNPKAPRFGMLTWEHQAGRRCFEWGCYECGKDADGCECDEEQLVACDACKRPEEHPGEATRPGTEWHRFARYSGHELIRTAYLCPGCNDKVMHVVIDKWEQL